jgi:phosphonate transport system substrate-binding protein
MCLAVGLLGWAPGARAELILGVHPFKPPSQLVEAFMPLARYLGEKLGEKVSVRIARDYQAHIDATGRDELDFAYFGPVPYVKLRDAYGPRPLLARQQIGRSPVFHGKIIVQKDSAIRALTDLKGKRFAFGEPHSTMSHLVPRYMLWQAGITVDRLASHKFVGDHVNVALGVLAGDHDAGAVKEDVFYQHESRGLRALATSEPLSDHLFVASNRLPEARLRRLREALLQLDRDPQGVAVLNSLTRGVTALVPVQDSDYDSLRRVLRKLRELGVES